MAAGGLRRQPRLQTGVTDRDQHAPLDFVGVFVVRFTWAVAFALVCRLVRHLELGRLRHVGFRFKLSAFLNLRLQIVLMLVHTECDAAIVPCRSPISGIPVSAVDFDAKGRNNPSSMLRRVLITLVLAAIGGAASFGADGPIRYRFTFPEPQHRWMQVEATFDELGSAPLELRMSRSSPGRYAPHDFAKNVYDVHAFNGEGREIVTTRPDPYGWIVADHGGVVTVKYKIFGDYIDGTYLAVDATHAHINMPAAIMWARGLDDRAITLSFDPPDRNALAGRHPAPRRRDPVRVHRAQPPVPDGQPRRVRSDRDPPVRGRRADVPASPCTIPVPTPSSTGSSGTSRRLFARKARFTASIRHTSPDTTRFSRITCPTPPTMRWSTATAR